MKTIIDFIKCNAFKIIALLNILLVVIILIDFSSEEKKAYEKEFSQFFNKKTRNCVNCKTDYFFYIESKDEEDFFIPEQIDFTYDFAIGQKFTIYKTFLLNRNNKIEFYFGGEHVIKNISLLDNKIVYYIFILIVLLSTLYFLFSNFKYSEGVLGISTLINFCLMLSYFCNF